MNNIKSFYIHTVGHGAHPLGYAALTGKEKQLPKRTWQPATCVNLSIVKLVSTTLCISAVADAMLDSDYYICQQCTYRCFLRWNAHAASVPVNCFRCSSLQLWKTNINYSILPCFKVGKLNCETHDKEDNFNLVSVWIAGAYTPLLFPRQQVRKIGPHCVHNSPVHNNVGISWLQTK